MRKFILAPLVGALVVAVALLGANLVDRAHDGAEAAAPWGDLLIDPIPDGSNTTSAFGTIELCRDDNDSAGDLVIGNEFVIDVVIDDGGAVAGSDYWLNFEGDTPGPAVLEVVGYNWASWKLGTGIDMTEPVPVTDGTFYAGWAGSASSGDGVITRITLKAVADGTSDLFLTTWAVSDEYGSPYIYPDVDYIDPFGSIRVVVGSGECPADTDGDTVFDTLDNCPTVANADQADADGDAVPGTGGGDACDNCPAVSNPGWANNDGDTYGDACDNCPNITNQDQANNDGDTLGDVCDNCPNVTNQGQEDDIHPGGGGDHCDDPDSDGLMDIADPCPDDADNDADGDLYCNGISFQASLGMNGANDNCPTVSNPTQADVDGDGAGDACDVCPDDPLDDQDGDGICVGPRFLAPMTGGDDNCPTIANSGQEDVVHPGGGGDACDDPDADGIMDDVDNCPDTSNSGQENVVHPGTPAGDACDDPDSDGVMDDVDNCPDIANAGQENYDGDSEGDACDTDDDNDSVLDGPDLCDPDGPLPNSPEDIDGVDDGDGCADTDPSVGAVTKWWKSASVGSITTGPGSPNYVTVKSTINNGNFGPAGVMVAFSQTSFIIAPDNCDPYTGGNPYQPACDPDMDGWVNFTEVALLSDAGNPAITPEAAVTPDLCSTFDGAGNCTNAIPNGVADTCEDGVDNDQLLGIDMLDPKCTDSDGDHIPDAFELVYGSMPAQIDSVPEHAGLPWTCFDGIDNDMDGKYDNDLVSPNPEGDGDGDGLDDCSQAQLLDNDGDTVADVDTHNCGSGWIPAGPPSTGEFTGMLINPNGDIVSLDVFPVVLPAPGASVPVERTEIIICSVMGNWMEINAVSIMSMLPPAVAAMFGLPVVLEESTAPPANNQVIFPLGVEVTADFDGDGVLDTVDDCYADPEDLDGVDDTDGCPEGDIVVSNFGLSTAHPTILQNVEVGGWNYHFDLTFVDSGYAIQDADVECTLQQISGPECVSHFAGETSFMSLNGQKISEVKWTETALSAGETRNFGGAYSLLCTEASPPTYIDTFSVTCLPLSGLSEPPPGNLAGVLEEVPANNSAAIYSNVTSTPNADGDSEPDATDNCPNTPNDGQEDDVHPGGGGDACDDPDSDGVMDDVDNCPDDDNAGQADLDSDGEGDVCDDDIDGDGVDNGDEEAGCELLADCDSDGIDDDVDQCDLLPEITDGELDGDGCPDTDARVVSVLPGSVINMVAGVPYVEAVTATWQNGDETADLKLTLLDYIGWPNCDGDWTPQAGDLFVSDEVDINGDTVLDRHLSIIERTYNDVAPDAYITLIRTRTVTCGANVPACDDDDVIGTVEVLDPVEDPDYSNNVLQVDHDLCADSDGDGDTIPDGIDNCPGVYNPDQDDYDSDGAGDACDDDDDDDGTSDVDEVACGSDPLNAASTCEVCDGIDNDLNDGVDEGFPDTDSDGEADCVDDDDDGDGISDLDEVACGSDPLNAASTCEVCDGVDNDLNDGIDEGFTDTDSDGEADCVDDDDDGDGMLDTYELANTCLNPLVVDDAADADSDGLSNIAEMNLGTDPCDDDTDDDGELDGDEESGCEFIQDCDGDGILDGDDDCDLLPEDFDGFEDTDGCPEADTHDDSVDPSETGHAVTVFGPAPVQMGDTLGRYMYVTGYVTNLGLHTDEVQMSLSVTNLPAECSVEEIANPMMPPVGNFLLLSAEVKPVVYRAVFECTCAATEGEYDVTITFEVDHIDTGTGDEVGPALDNNDVDIPIVLTVSLGVPDICTP